MAQEPQSFKNHAKLDPLFHFFLLPVSFLLLLGGIVNVIEQPSHLSVHFAILSLWAFLATFKMRAYALKVQDRVIRLEERLRLRELAPAALQEHLGNLTEDQLIGLRFASDGEAAGLATQALASNWNRKQIKEAIKNWRPDNWRV